jgi:two-component system cell cycle response regulator DivK
MKRSVLLIEDNEQNRYLLTFLLERNGYTVMSVADGARGVEAARISSPTLILLDIQLPTMDGYAVARALREIETIKQTPIIAVTSYAMPGDREKALDAGCTGYMEKPINPETFVAEMELALSPASPRQT